MNRRCIRNKETGQTLTGEVTFDGERILVFSGTHDGQDFVVMYNKIDKRFYPPYNIRWEFTDPLMLAIKNLPTDVS